MDTVKFVKEYLRMCTNVEDCENCPVYKTDFCTAPVKKRTQESAEEIVKLVEEWSAAHPRKTRQSVFLEQYPEAKLDGGDCLELCPCTISAAHRDEYGCCAVVDTNCFVCRREFWMQEVE